MRNSCPSICSSNGMRTLCDTRQFVSENFCSASSQSDVCFLERIFAERAGADAASVESAFGSVPAAHLPPHCSSCFSPRPPRHQYFRQPHSSTNSFTIIVFTIIFAL
eukprot:m.89214 g.89214  ORF g.89214 m.89214 type:complete len:107 (+) comp51028_c0_seq7:20-340(+)